jgi:simple sugar transport system permease protein
MENIKKGFKHFLNSVKFPLIAIVLSFLIGSIFIVLTGNSPLTAYKALFVGSLASNKIGETLLMTIPLIFTGLSVAFAFRCGLFNIGAEGQYVLGAIFAVATGWYLQGLPGFILIPLIIFSGAVGGALWGAIPGVLKARLGVHEVIVTIMLNYISIPLSNFITINILNPEKLQGTIKKAHTVLLPEHARLTKLATIFPGLGHSSLHGGIFIAIAVAVLIWFVLFKTTLGYEIRSVGNNPYAAEYGGISVSKNIILAMVISGALAGLAGSLIVVGLTYKVDQMAGSAGYGFTGIAVALVGKNHPLGVLVSSFLFGTLANGARKMQIVGIPQEVVGIIQSIIIIFIAGEEFLKKIPGFNGKIKKTGSKIKKEVAK